jgi:peptidoglycan/xylan/chitin deacetylase (PgdA/CDA1 family)
MFDARGFKFTCYAVGRAIELNPEVGKAFVESGHEIASHGYRWINYQVRRIFLFFFLTGLPV